MNVILQILKIYSLHQYQYKSFVYKYQIHIKNIFSYLKSIILIITVPILPQYSHVKGIPIVHIYYEK